MTQILHHRRRYSSTDLNFVSAINTYLISESDAPSCPVILPLWIRFDLGVCSPVLLQKLSLFFLSFYDEAKPFLQLPTI